MYEKLISNSKPFDLALNLRDDLVQELNSYFTKELFKDYWNMSLKMTLSWIEWKVIKSDLLSKEYLNILESNNFDIKTIYFNAIYDRAFMINKYVEYIIDEEYLYPIIFSDLALSRNIDDVSARTLLIKLWYLDIVFCKNNIHKLGVSNLNMFNNINNLFEIYNDYVDYFSSMQDLWEDDRLNTLQNHIMFFREMNTKVMTKYYYQDLNNLILK